MDNVITVRGNIQELKKLQDLLDTLKFKNLCPVPGKISPRSRAKVMHIDENKFRYKVSPRLVTPSMTYGVFMETRWNKYTTDIALAHSVLRGYPVLANTQSVMKDKIISAMMEYHNIKEERDGRNV